MDVSLFPFCCLSLLNCVWLMSKFCSSSQSWIADAITYVCPSVQRPKNSRRCLCKDAGRCKWSVTWLSNPAAHDSSQHCPSTRMQLLSPLNQSTQFPWSKDHAVCAVIADEASFGTIDVLGRRVNYLWGWMRTVVRSSTAAAAAIIEIPGRDTVHCWSRVRSCVDWTNKQRRHSDHHLNILHSSN